MPKLDKRTMILTSIVTLLPMLIGAALWKRLPDVMATHFDLNNEANGFSSKLFSFFLICTIRMLSHICLPCSFGIRVLC